MLDRIWRNAEEVKLKPCPFCGSEVIVPPCIGNMALGAEVKCGDCNAVVMFNSCKLDTREVAKKWNHRAAGERRRREMRASIEKSLYIGILKTRFDLFDNVRLCLKTGEVIEGTIEGFEGNSVVQIETENGRREINVDDIEDYD